LRQIRFFILGKTSEQEHWDIVATERENHSRPTALAAPTRWNPQLAHAAGTGHHDATSRVRRNDVDDGCLFFGAK
jgi:hypothetical protein